MKSETYRCGFGALWLPRALAGAFLVASLFAAFRLDASRGLAFAKPLQVAVVVVGAFLGLWILRAGSEVRIRLHFEGPRLFFSSGRQSAALELSTIERLDHEAPFGATRRLFPAAVLIERNGRPWRLPVVLDRGGALIDEVVRRSGRSDLAAWSETLDLNRHMRRGKTVLAAGYAFAVLVMAAGFLFYVR